MKGVRQLMARLLYGGGLRLMECVRLRVQDLDFKWQFVFPSRKISADPRTGKRRRHHVQYSGLQKAVKAAVLRCGILY
jgi:integrase